MCNYRERKVLNMYEEAKIVQHIRIMASHAYVYTMQKCIGIEYAVSLGKISRNDPLTLRWMNCFS